ncbi:MAG: acylphosphatase [Elusimicrobiota bacterium]
MKVQNGKQRVHAVISGEVQGIGFRWFVQKTAADMNIDGWVKNLPNSDVELEAEGNKEALESFLDAVQKKHSWARVDKINIEPLTAYNAKKSDFKIIF